MLVVLKSDVGEDPQDATVSVSRTAPDSSFLPTQPNQSPNIIPSVPPGSFLKTPLRDGDVARWMILARIPVAASPATAARSDATGGFPAVDVSRAANNVSFLVLNEHRDS